jgi:hypothetical protein
MDIEVEFDERALLADLNAWLVFLKVESRGYADDRDVGELPIGSLEFAND